jgi:hypothetical protein
MFPIQHQNYNTFFKKNLLLIRLSILIRAKQSLSHRNRVPPIFRGGICK